MDFYIPKKQENNLTIETCVVCKRNYLRKTHKGRRGGKLGRAYNVKTCCSKCSQDNMKKTSTQIVIQKVKKVKKKFDIKKSRAYYNKNKVRINKYCRERYLIMKREAQKNG